MKITKIVTTPLLVPYAAPYYWAQGVIEGAGVILVEVHTDTGVTGYGESVATPSAAAIQGFLKIAGDICIGRSPFENVHLMQQGYHALFQALGTCSAPRFGAQVLAGLEMALWDAMGKSVDRPVHDLLGGAIREEIKYFGFAQGETADETAIDAKRLAASGIDVIYVKVGRGDRLDLDIVRQVREAIGPDSRLRLDANEKWSPLRASRMIRKLSAYDIEFVEQPTDCQSISALALVRQTSPVAIAADQTVFNSYDAYNVCRAQAADLIVLGLHETGGIHQFLKTAHIAEAAGTDICIHGLYETGITTCASAQVAAVVANLDDGNQYMNHFLAWDIIKSPDLELNKGRLAVNKAPGLGFELDLNAVARAHETYLQSVAHHD